MASIDSIPEQLRPAGSAETALFLRAGIVSGVRVATTDFDNGQSVGRVGRKMTVGADALVTMAVYGVAHRFIDCIEYSATWATAVAAVFCFPKWFAIVISFLMVICR